MGVLGSRTFETLKLGLRGTPGTPRSLEVRDDSGDKLSPSEHNIMLRNEAYAAFAPYNGFGDTLSQYPMRAVAAKMYKFDQAASGVRLTELTFGSSVADVKIREGLAQAMLLACGGLAGVIFGTWSNGTTPFGGAGSFTFSSTGAGWTARNNDFDVWPTGDTSLMSAAGSVTVQYGGGNPYCDSIEIIYLTGPSSNGLDGGVFSYRVDSGSETQVNTSAATPGIARVVIPVTAGAHNWTLTWVSGNVRIIGFAFFNSTINGMVPMSIAKGGINLWASGDQAFANMSTTIGWYQPDFITMEMKGGQIDSWANTAGSPTTVDGAPALVHFKKWLDAVDAACTDYAGPDIVVIGSTPDQNSGVYQRALNDALSVECRSRQPKLNALAWDSYRILGNGWTSVSSRDTQWRGDGTHMGGALSRFLAGRLLADLGILDIPAVPFSSYRAAFQNLKTYGDLEIRRGSDIGRVTPTLKIKAETGFGFDARLAVDRWLDFTDATESTILARFAARNGDSFIPGTVRVGNGVNAPFLRSSGNDTLYVARGTNGNVNGSFASGNYGATVTDIANASGSVSLDFSVTTVYRLLVTGNITAINVTGLNMAAQECEIWFVWNGTAYTVSGLAAAIKLAGGALPTLSSTNGYSDIFTFRNVSGSLYERSRALAVR